jgi:hypothetical protein
MNIDPLAEKTYSWTPYHYVQNNPINMIDPDGLYGIFVNSKGEKIGDDGIDDGKVYVVKTSKTKFDSGASSAGISNKERKATEKFIKKNSGNTEAFKKNSIAYDNSVEIEGSTETRQSMVDIVNQDNGKGGTSDANNREYGGTISNDGIVTESTPGPVADPSKSSHAGISHTIYGDTKSTFHSHPSGTKRIEGGANNGGSMNGMMSGGTSHQDFNFFNAPSSTDINNAGSGLNYSFSRGNGVVYIYNNALCY